MTALALAVILAAAIMVIHDVSRPERSIDSGAHAHENQQRRRIAAEE